ncbi:TPA: fimbrial biogenesis outer membrane usher protein, partial [Pseudomonas aeruginosa]|nr:fimbrial biogenesis outer membrane usher protein [Pseudomonas aeruginosa]
MAIFRKKFDFELSVYSRSSCLMALGLALPAVTFAVEFNAEFLNNEGGAPVELKYFENGNSVSPGTYSVDIHLNQIMIRREDVVFSADPETGSVRPVVRVGLLKEIGVDIARLTRDKLIPDNLENNTPLNVAELIPGASIEFDVNSLSLLVSIPQLYVQRHSRGYVDPSLWDDGVTALFSNYQANFTRNTNFGQNSDYRYLGLRNGFNLFGWRLRNDSSLSGGTGMRNKFSSNRTYVERDIRALKGTLSLGELYTSAQGDAFESVRMRGVQLQSDIGMLPDNEISYTPVVRGIAETNATVEVSQNGFVIYSTNVPPGAFEITDIYPSGSNGDLEVKIIEADGRQRSFKQSYSYLPVMTRKGNLRYGLAAGEYHNDGQPSVNLLQGSAVYGLSDRVTGFGGLLAAEKYNATNLGLGFNTPLGGFSADVTHSQSRTRR